MLSAILFTGMIFQMNAVGLPKIFQVRLGDEVGAGAMSAGALGRRIAPDGVSLWRFFARRKLAIDGYEELVQRLGALRFDGRRGVLVTSPLHGASGRPRKTSVLFAGSTRAEVDQLEADFRARCEG